VTGAVQAAYWIAFLVPVVLVRPIHRWGWVIGTLVIAAWGLVAGLAQRALTRFRK
jgi:hypothetical protein